MSNKLHDVQVADIVLSKCTLQVDAGAMLRVRNLNIDGGIDETNYRLIVYPAHVLLRKIIDDGRPDPATPYYTFEHEEWNNRSGGSMEFDFGSGPLHAWLPGKLILLEHAVYWGDQDG